MKQTIIFSIISFIIGFVICSIWFTPEIETTTETKTSVEESVTETESDSTFTEEVEDPEPQIASADTIFISTSVESEDSIQTTKAKYSNSSIGLVANIEHSGYIYNVEFEYIQKTRLVRETRTLRIVEREITSLTKITKTIKPPILKLRASAIFSPSMLAITSGIQYHSLHIEAGKNFINNEPVVQVGVSFSPSKLIKKIF